MEPQPQNQDESPIPLKATPVSQPKKGLKLPLFLIFGPIVILIGNFILYALFNLITSSAGHSLDVLRTIVNIILFLIGVATILGGPVSFIIGIVLLANRSSQK